MISAATNIQVLNRSTSHFHGVQFGHLNVSRSCPCQLNASNAIPEGSNFQQAFLETSTSQSKETVATYRRHSAVYHNSTEVQHYPSSQLMEFENLKTEPVQYFCPTRFKESHFEHARSSQGNKVGRWHHQDTSKRASISELTSHNGLAKGEHKMELPGNLRYHVVYESREKSPSSSSGKEQFGSTRRLKPQFSDSFQNAVSLTKKKQYLEEKEEVYLKPNEYQSTQSKRSPMVVGDRDNFASGIQSSRKHLGPRYLEDFQNPTAPDTTGELKHHSLDSAWLPKHTPATIQALSKPDVHPAPHPDSIQSYPGGNVNLPQPLRCEPTCVPGQTIGTITPLFSHAEVPSSSHFSHGNSYAPIQHMAIGGPSAQCHAPSVVLADTSKPTAPSNNHPHFYPEGCRPLTEKEHRNDGDLNQCYECSERPKCVPPKRVLVALPVRCADVPIENYSQKANFPVQPILYVPLHGQSSLCSDYKGDGLGPTRFAESYCAKEAGADWVSSNGSTNEFKISGAPHCSGFPPNSNSYKNIPSSCATSQVKASQGVLSPAPFHSQSASEGFCCPAEISRETSEVMESNRYRPLLHQSGQDALLPTMSSSHPNYPGPSTAHPASVRDVTNCNPCFESVNDHVSLQSYKIYHSNNSACSSKNHQQELANGIHDHRSLVNDSQVVNKQQTSNQRIGDNIKSGDAPRSAWNPTGHVPGLCRVEHTLPALNVPDESQDSVTMKEPRCYISVDSKPLIEEKNEQNNCAQRKKRLRKNTVPPSEGTVIPNSSHSDSRLSKLETFVVGLETEIHWKKCKPKNKRSESSASETEMQIVSISSTQHQNQFPPDKPSVSSGSDSEDSINTIRLERVYYSANPCVQSRDDIRLPAKPAAPHRVLDYSQSSVFSVDKKESDSVSFRGKASKNLPAIKKDRNKAKVSGKRKTGDKCTKRDQVRVVKRRRRETKKPRNTVKMLLEKQRLFKKESQTMATVESNTCFKDIKTPGCC